MRRMFRLALVVPVWFIVGCGGLDQPANEVVDGGEVVVDLSGDVIKGSLLAAGTPGVDETTTVYGYKAYKIPYTTTDEEGNSVEVSGLMVVPTGLPDVVYSTLGLSMVSDSHETIFANADAPTQIAGATSSVAGSPVALTSLGGFVTLQADYIGFGDSVDHYHPFMLKKSLANATVDFINAAKVFATNNDINLNGQLFLTGYSEGGYAAMATLQKIETETDLQVTLSAPMAGPYAIEALAKGVLSAPVMPIPSFMTNVGYAYSFAYDIDIASIVNEPYASSLDDLFDGSKARPEIDAALTTQTTGVDGLFNPDFVADFLAPEDNWFNLAARENDVHTWVPKSSVRLLHCLGDDVVPYALSELTEGTMLAMSGGAADVSIVPIEVAVTQDPTTALRYGHVECGPVAYSVATKIFAETRALTIGY